MADEHLTMILSYEVDQYQVMIKSKQLIQSLSKWREQATKLEMLLTDCVDYQCLRRELDVFITCMDNVDDASTTFVDLYMETEVDIPIDMEYLEIYNHELVKRICSKMIMLKDTKSNVSKVSMISSSTFRRSDTDKQAAAIAAELEVKFQYMYMEAEQYELERNRTEKELAMSFEVDQYQVMIKSKQLIQSLPKWREQATKLEMLLTDCVDYQCLRRELDVFITCMDNVDDASTTFVDLYMETEVDIPIDMEDLEIYNHELVKRICSKMIMLKDTKSNVSKVSMISSSTLRRSDTGMQAAAIAAELEVKLQYMYMEAEQCKLDRNRTEKELAIAKARLRAVNEVNGLQDVSQTQSVTIERLPYANCIDGFMQLDSVHYPVNEEYIDRLAKLRNILAKCDSTCVAVVGDYNANVLKNANFAVLLKEYCSQFKYKWSSCLKLPEGTHTYVSDAWGSYSWLDHIISTEDGNNVITNMYVLYGTVQSDHIPLVAHIDLQLAPGIDQGATTNMGNKIDWAFLSEDILYEYGVQSEILLSNVEIPTDVILCKDCNCNNVEHKEALNKIIL